MAMHASAIAPARHRVKVIIPVYQAEPQKESEVFPTQSRMAQTPNPKGFPGVRGSTDFLRQAPQRYSQSLPHQEMRSQDFETA
jgi:hypothetical protein